MKTTRQSPLNLLIIHFDRNILQVLSGTARGKRRSPAETIEESPMSEATRRHIASLMRVNYSGEVCAQALYQGQAMLACQRRTQEKMRQAADEEIDHLGWCAERIYELGGHTSLLDPIWFMGSLSMGILVGLAGDDWSLGFIEETEHQVVAHLQGHLDQLPESDKKTRAILSQMQLDESEHGEKAIANGARRLPALIRSSMRLCAKLMTGTSYYI